MDAPPTLLSLSDDVLSEHIVRRLERQGDVRTLRALSQTCKRLRILANSRRVFHLRAEVARRFATDAAFRSELCKEVVGLPKNRLSICLGHPRVLEELDKLPQSPYGQMGFGAVYRVHEAQQARCPRDLTVFAGVYALDLSGFQGITDVSGLRDIHVLDLSSCSNITDLSPLENVHTLIAKDVRADTSALRGVKHVVR